MQAMVPYEKTEQASGGRTTIVTLGVLLMASAFPLILGLKEDLPIAVWATSLVMLGSLAMFRSGSLFGQVLARGVWWQSLALGVVFGVGVFVEPFLSGKFATVAAMLSIGGALAIAGAGRHGLERLSPKFAPTAFRTSLMVSLVMALADTGSLLFYGGITIEESGAWTAPLPFFACAAAMMVAVHGLYRLRLWGLALNIVANVVIAGIAVAGLLDLPDVLAYGLAATALVQLLIPVPLVRAMLRGK